MKNKNLIKRVGNIVTVKLFDRMLDRQTKQLSRMLQHSIASSGGRKISMILSVESQAQSNSPESLFESLQFLKIHSDNIDRIAIVGNKAWERTYVALFGLFGGIDIEYFDRPRAFEAIKWVQHLPRDAFSKRLKK